ncbi:MAG: glycosyltransferase [Tannerellaceae bacterium]|jgi:glycosyltransferase involved in cell wall biosynthesis|nr:glycosyltransferase [Tannerellaceae bacterium]
MNQLSAQPLVTIVTVVYNAKENIAKTIRNVASQDYNSIEYIVVDGGSSDGTVGVIQECSSWITAWISEKDDGIYQAMNKGIRMASGEWICFLNAGDCFVGPDTISMVMRETARLPEQPDVIYGNTYVEKIEGQLSERVAQPPGNRHRMYFAHQSAFVRSSVAKRYLFDENYRLSSDFKFFKQCYYGKQTFVRLNFAVTIYDLHGISNLQRVKGLRENISVVKELDRGVRKYVFLLRLYFVIYWQRLRGKQ